MRGFIRYIREGNVSGALEIIRKENGFPSICGRVCMAPCEIACVLNDEGSPIGIRALERFASEQQRKSNPPKISGKTKVAVIGSGPSGLTAARQLNLKGYAVTVIDAMNEPGGMLRYALPEFRMPKRVLDQEIKELEQNGVTMRTNVLLGQTLTLDDLLKEGFSSIILAIGAGTPQFPPLKGINLSGVYFADEFLLRMNLHKNGNGQKEMFPIGPNVVILGTDNSALDAARVCVRKGSKATVIFGHTEEEMPVRSEEKKLATEEGVLLEKMAKALEIKSDDDNRVRAVKCVRMDYADTDHSGQWKLIEVLDDVFEVETDTVIVSTGHRPNIFASKIGSMKLNKDGSIWTDENGKTSLSGIFACGDVATNRGQVVEAMASGKRIAENVDAFLKNK